MAPPVLKRKLDGGGYESYELTETVTTLGRSKSCTITVNDSSLSRLHFRLENRDGRIFLVDNNSSNGTFLNRRKITEALLTDGDLIMTGRVHFVYSSPDEKAGERTQPLSLVNEPEVGNTISMSMPDIPSENQSLPSGTNLEFDSLSGEESMPPPPPPPMAPPAAMAPPSAMSPPPPMPSSTSDQASPTEHSDAPTPVSRLLAFLIDIGVNLAIGIPAYIFPLMGLSLLGTLWSLLAALAGLTHIIGGWAVYGKTVGKHVMGLQIIADEDPTRRGLEPKTLAMRILGYIICAVPCGLGFLTVIIGDDDRGFHNKFAGTRVISTK